MKCKGFGLVILVMLIAVFGLIFVGTSLVFTNGVRETQLRIDKTKAHYLAQAGVMRAIYEWYISDSQVDNRTYSPVNYTFPSTNLSFRTGNSQVNSASYDFGAASWTLGNPRKRLFQWQIKNGGTTGNIVVKAVKVSWTPVDTSAKLT